MGEYCSKSEKTNEYSFRIIMIYIGILSRSINLGSEFSNTADPDFLKEY